MKIFPRTRIFYVSPWLLAAATALLVLIVVTFTLNNIVREKELMTRAMLQKADTLVRIVHSGSRSAYLRDLRDGIWQTDPWQEYVQQVINHVAEDPDLRFLALIDESSRVVVHNDAAVVGKRLDFTLPAQLPATTKTPYVRYRITDIKESGRIFEVVHRFNPHRSFLQNIPRTWLRQQPHGRILFTQPGINLLREHHEKLLANLEDHTYYVLVGLDMQSYDQSLRRIKMQTMGLSFVMLLVGLGGWLSLAAVQGYRVSQKTLGEMKLFTSLLLAKLPVGIIAVDSEGKITTFNESAARLLSVDRENVMGGKADAVLPGAFATFFQDDRSGGEHSPGREKEISVVLEGVPRHYLCHRIAIDGGDWEKQGTVLLVSDLTELKSLEREMRENERLAAVGRMAAGVAHEVRNPLSSIKGLALLLKEKVGDNPNDRKAAGLLVEQVERINRTVSELLSFARPGSLNLRKTSLQALLRDTLRLIQTDAGSENIETELQLDPELMEITADPDRLNQVFINLMLNSVQAMPEGGKLTVSAKNKSMKGTVEIRISDTGCGIPRENMSQLFYPYFTTRQGGTGIGLALSQKIVNDHKGSIRVDSVEGAGTTVTVVLPVQIDSGHPGA